MKSLTTYICESFIDYDTALENVPEKMKDVAKLKILINKFDKFGEENSYEDGKDPFDQLLNMLSNIVKEKKFDELQKERRNSYSEDYKQKVKNRTKYCDKLFSAVYNNYKKENDKYGWGDISTLTSALIGIAYWIENYAGFQEKEADTYLGKLCAKYEKVFGISADAATQITQMYDKQKVSIQQAIDAENKTKASVQEIKDDFKNHKYTIFADSHDSAVQMYIVKNEDYDTLDDAFEQTAGNEGPGSPLENYSLEGKLRQLVKDGKINALFLCSGYYCIGQDQNKTIPTFGYYDDDDIITSEIWDYSTYDHKFYYKGKIGDYSKHRNGQGNSYEYYDSLWTVHKK